MNLPPFYNYFATCYTFRQGPYRVLILSDNSHLLTQTNSHILQLFRNVLHFSTRSIQGPYFIWQLASLLTQTISHILQLFRNGYTSRQGPYRVLILCDNSHLSWLGLIRTTASRVVLPAITLAVWADRRLLHKSISANMLLFAGNAFLQAHRYASRLTPCSLHVQVLELKRADRKWLATVFTQNIALI
jgi:hypothetical protein